MTAAIKTKRPTPTERRLSNLEERSHLQRTDTNTLLETVNDLTLKVRAMQGALETDVHTLRTKGMLHDKGMVMMQDSINDLNILVQHVINGQVAERKTAKAIKDLKMRSWALLLLVVVASGLIAALMWKLSDVNTVANENRGALAQVIADQDDVKRSLKRKEAVTPPEDPQGYFNWLRNGKR